LAFYITLIIIIYLYIVFNIYKNSRNAGHDSFIVMVQIFIILKIIEKNWWQNKIKTRRR